jgi:hypothetical protein
MGARKMLCHPLGQWVSGEWTHGTAVAVDLPMILVELQVSLQRCIHITDQRFCRIARHQIFFCIKYCSNCLPFNRNSKGFSSSGEWRAQLSR